MKMFLMAVVLLGGFGSFVAADEAELPKPDAKKPAGPLRLISPVKPTTLAAKLLAEWRSKQQSSPLLQEKITHLRKAAEHLSAAGMTAQAKQARLAIEEVQREINRQLLTHKIAQLKELTAEIEQLRGLTGQQIQIEVEVHVFEVSLDKLKALGGDMAVIAEQVGKKGFIEWNRNPIVAKSLISGLFSRTTGRKNTNQSINELLKAIQKAGAAKLIANPQLITISGREAWFQSGGELSYPATDDAGNPTVKAEWFGTKLEVVPTVLADGKIGLEIRAGVSEIDPDWSVQSGTPPRIHHTKMHTYVELQSGDPIVIAGFRSHKTVDQGETKPGDATNQTEKDSLGSVELIFTAAVKVIDPIPSATPPMKLVPKTARRPSVLPSPPIYSTPSLKPYPQLLPATKR